MTQFEREEEQLEKDYASGLISLKEFNDQMRELRRDYRDASIESAERAYADELERW